MAEQRYKFMKIVKQLGINIEKKLTAYSKHELENIIITYNRQKWAVNKITSNYKKYRCKKIEVIDKNELQRLKNKIKELEIENFKSKKQIDDLKYHNKCKQEELSRIIKYNSLSGDSSNNSDDSEHNKRKIPYDKIPEMSTYKMKKYLHENNIEICNNYSTHELKQTINRCNNNKYKRLFNIGVVN